MHRGARSQSPHQLSAEQHRISSEANDQAIGGRAAKTCRSAAEVVRRDDRDQQLEGCGRSFAGPSGAIAGRKAARRQVTAAALPDLIKPRDLADVEAAVQWALAQQKTLE